MFEALFVILILGIPLWVIQDKKKSLLQKTEEFRRERPGSEAQVTAPAVPSGTGGTLPLIRTNQRGALKPRAFASDGASDWGVFAHPHDVVSHNSVGVHDVHVGDCDHGHGEGGHGGAHC